MVVVSEVVVTPRPCPLDLSALALSTPPLVPVAMVVDSVVGSAAEVVSREDSAVIVDLVGPVEVSDTKVVATDSVEVDRLPPTPLQVREADAAVDSVVVPLAAADLSVNPAALPAATENPSGPGTGLATAIVETGIGTATVTVTGTVTGIAIATVTGTVNATAIVVTGTEAGATTTGGSDTMKMIRMMTPVPKEDTERLSAKDIPIPVFSDGLLVGIINLVLLLLYPGAAMGKARSNKAQAPCYIGLQPSYNSQQLKCSVCIIFPS